MNIKVVFLTFILPLLIALFGVLYYVRSVNYGFSIGEEYWFAQHFTLNDIRDFFTKPTWPAYSYYYRPIYQLTYALDYDIWGYNQRGYHIDSLIYYGVLLIIIYIFIYNVTDSLSLSLLTEFLFTLYPTHYPQGTLMTHRVDVVPTIFLLSGLTLFEFYLRRRSFFYSIGGILLLGLALFSKESTVSESLLVFIYLLFRLGLNREVLRKELYLFLGSAGVTLLYFFVRFILLSHSLGALPNDSVNLETKLFFGLVLNFGRTFIDPELFGHFLWNQILVLSVNIVFVLTFISMLYTKKLKILSLATLLEFLLAALLVLTATSYFFFRGALYIWFDIVLAVVGLVSWLKYRKGIKFNSFEKAGIFALAWMFFANIALIYLSKDRLVFIASVGYCLFVASVSLYVFTINRGLRYLILVSLVVLLSNYIFISKTWVDYNSNPKSAFSKLAKIEWFPGGINGDIWPGRQMDEYRKIEFTRDLQNEGLVDRNLCLKVDLKKLLKDAYWIYDVSDFSYKTFAASRVDRTSEEKDVKNKFITNHVGLSCHYDI